MTSHANPQKCAIFALNYRRIRQFGRQGAPALLLALAACGQPEAIVLTPPADLLRCADAPAVPELPPPGIERDRATVALWLAEREAGADCRAKVKGTAAWVAEVAD